MRYVVSKFRQDFEDTAYRFYISDGIMALTHNTRREGGYVLDGHYRNIINPPEERDDKEIIANIKKGLSEL